MFLVESRECLVAMSPPLGALGHLQEGHRVPSSEHQPQGLAPCQARGRDGQTPPFGCAVYSGIRRRSGKHGGPHSQDLGPTPPCCVLLLSGQRAALPP